MGWNRTGGGSSLNEMGPDSFFVEWDRTELLFGGMGQDRTRMGQNFLILAYIRNDNKK